MSDFDPIAVADCGTGGNFEEVMQDTLMKLLFENRVTESEPTLYILKIANGQAIGVFKTKPAAKRWMHNNRAIIRRCKKMHLETTIIELAFPEYLYEVKEKLENEKSKLDTSDSSNA